MKKYFTSGLVIFLPILLTILIVAFVINILTNPFVGNIEAIFHHFNLLEGTYFFIDGDDIIRFLSRFIVLIGLFGFIVFIGFVGKLFLIDYLFKLGYAVFHNIPYVNKIFKASQDVVHSLFSSESKSFSQVVFVPFPTAQTLSVGLVTKESLSVHSTDDSTEMIPVFVPGTPNPSVGFMLMFKKEQLIFVNMKIDEAIKFVVSCGVVMPNFMVTPADNEETK